MDKFPNLKITIPNQISSEDLEKIIPKWVNSGCLFSESYWSIDLTINSKDQMKFNLNYQISKQNN